MLVRLMYASRAVQGIDHDALGAILKQSKARNPQAGVTGVLCLSDGIFLQLLEGGRTPVSALYNRIAADKRHRDVTLLNFEEVAERQFGGWAMGQVNLSRLNPALVLKYCETTALDPYACSGKTVMSLFNELLSTAAIVCQN